MSVKVSNVSFELFKVLVNKEDDVIFGGRLADYKYYDMHHVIFHALKTIKNNF